jgi:hypothetical protein
MGTREQVGHPPKSEVLMLWGHVLLFALLVSTPPSTCSCETLNSFSYRLGPSDIDFGAMRVLRVTPDRFVMLKRPVGADHEQVYLSGNGEKWHRALHQQELTLRHLVTASGAGQGKTLYRILGDYSALEGSSALERSDDQCTTWRRANLRFNSLVGAPVLTQQQLRLRILGVNGLTLYASIAIRDETASVWK